MGRYWRPFLLLYAGDSLVLKDPHDDAPILGLAFSGLVVADWMGFAHRTGSEHSGKGDVALLKKNIRYIRRAVFAELLIQGGTAD